eukprot:XP_025000076.1 uncharacterized protein LOC112530427 [Gallus gallus]
MLQSRGQIPAATRHVRLWDAGKGHGNGVRADPALPRRSSAHMQLRGCGVASAGGWGVCPTDRCEADEGLISVSPLRYGGLQMQEQQRLPPNIGVVLPSLCHTVGRAAAALWYPMPPVPLWVGDTELKSHCSSALLQRAERTRDRPCFIPHPLGFGSVSFLPGAMPRKGQPVASLHAGEGRLLRPRSTSPLPLLPTKQSKRAIKEQKGAPLHLTLQNLPAPISLQTPATSVGRGGATACRSKTAAGVNGAGRAHGAGMAGHSFGIRSRCSSASLLSAREEMHQAAEQHAGHGGDPRTTAPCRAHLPGHQRMPRPIAAP